jgi:septum formation protein
MRLVLASTSPRRRELLALLEVPFEVRPPLCDEMILPQRSAGDLAAHFSKTKAEGVANEDPQALVLSSDTLIECDDRPYGKPRDLAEASAMLRQLAGRAHVVKTAVTAVCRDRRFETTETSTARVWMKPFDTHTHERYLATGDSLGKAGAYSIQGPGAELIERLEGDFTTVVGFPLRVVVRLLAQGGITVPVDVESLYVRKPYENWPRFPG